MRPIFFHSIIFFLSIFALEVNAQIKIVAKNDDTLLKISQRYGVHLKELMYKNNINDANITIEGKIILIPEKNNEKINNSENPTYKVVKGDTLYKIAKDYNIELKDIISINNLEINSYLKIDQIIILPKGASIKEKPSNKKNKLKVKKVFYHKTSKSEELSNISKIHKIPVKEIKNLNNIIISEKINPNIKLKLRENKSFNWLKYGSLMIDWSDWTYQDGNYFTRAKTKNKTSFYIGLSCKKRALINTLNNANWKTWYFPENDFEFKLINDFCE